MGVFIERIKGLFVFLSLEVHKIAENLSCLAYQGRTKRINLFMKKLWRIPYGSRKG